MNVAPKVDDGLLDQLARRFIASPTNQELASMARELLEYRTASASVTTNGGPVCCPNCASTFNVEVRGGMTQEQINDGLGRAIQSLRARSRK